MRQFNAKQIKEIKAHFKKSRFPELKMEVAGRNFNYFLFPQGCNTALPDFVVMATTQFARERIMAISESWPGALRPYPLLHEHMEFIEIGKDEKDRCRRALEMELDEVPSGLRPAYLPRRTRFFRNLIAQAEAHPEVYLFTEQDFRELRKSLNYLERLRS